MVNLAASAVLVVARSGGYCERCIYRPGTQIHHRVARQAGGSKKTPWINRPSNLLHLCGTSASGCHGVATMYPETGRVLGLVVPRGVAEQRGGCSTVPFWDTAGRAWTLGDDGTKNRYTEPLEGTQL